MANLINKDALVAEIERFKENANKRGAIGKVSTIVLCNELLSSLDTLEVVDPYEQLIQYASIEAGIKAHAEEYSFNIESELFNQLTKEQQKLWRREIEEAAISGGYNGLSLAKDPRYKENSKVKKVDLEKHLKEDIEDALFDLNGVAVKGATHYLTVEDVKDIAKHFFELGLLSTITEEDCKLIWNIGDEIPNMPEEEFFKELLKRYKAQKGEEV